MSTFFSACQLACLFDSAKCKWRKPNNFVMAVLVIALWINPVIIVLWNIFMQSSFRLLIVKMLVLAICQNSLLSKLHAASGDYWLKMFTLRNTDKKHAILGRTLVIQYLVLNCFLRWYFTFFPRAQKQNFREFSLI